MLHPLIGWFKTKKCERIIGRAIGQVSLLSNSVIDLAWIITSTQRPQHWLAWLAETDYVMFSQQTTGNWGQFYDCNKIPIILWWLKLALQKWRHFFNSPLLIFCRHFYRQWRSAAKPLLFSSPEHEVLMVSYCDHFPSGVRPSVCPSVNFFLQSTSPS